jgi:hypothetical protein
MRDMLSTTFCVKAPPIVLTPIIVVGLMLSIAATKSRVSRAGDSPALSHVPRSGRGELRPAAGRRIAYPAGWRKLVYPYAQIPDVLLTNRVGLHFPVAHRDSSARAIVH